MAAKSAGVADAAPLPQTRPTQTACHSCCLPAYSQTTWTEGLLCTVRRNKDSTTSLLYILTIASLRNADRTCSEVAWDRVGAARTKVIKVKHAHATSMPSTVAIYIQHTMQDKARAMLLLRTHRDHALQGAPAECTFDPTPQTRTLLSTCPICSTRSYAP